VIEGWGDSGRVQEGSERPGKHRENRFKSSATWGHPAEALGIAHIYDELILAALISVRP